MNKINPSTKLYTFFMTAYDHFNKTLFNSELPQVILTLQRQANTMGYFSSGRWGSKDGVELHEIAVNPQFFVQHPMIEIFQTLVHEMCHLWQHEFGTPSRRSYHNREWADKMLSVGLVPSTTGRPGGKEVGQKMNDYPENGGLFESQCKSLVATGVLLPYYDRHVPRTFTIPDTPEQVEVDELEDDVIDEIELVLNQPLTVDDIHIPSAQTTQSKQKYNCSGCGINLWGKPKLNVICGDCDVQLREV